MNMLIKQLNITSFKGIKDLTLNLEGSNATISGRNGTGKTSIYDAFLWLLFGKDSTGASQFDVKPLDPSGDKVTGSDVEVEAVLLVDEKTVTLKRSLHEVWKKISGSAQPIYTGDETLVWIDEVPVKLVKEYQPYIQQIAGDEDTFKLLAVHGAFMKLPWDQRRKMLLRAAGSDVDSIILARPEFERVPDILAGKTPEDAKKRLKDGQKRYNDELKSLPVRIDELRLNISPITQKQADEAQTNLDRIDSDITRINGLLSGSEESFLKAAELIDHKEMIREKMSALKQGIANLEDDKKRQLDRAIDALLHGAKMAENETAQAKRNIAEYQTKIDQLEESRTKKLAQWHEANEQTYPATVIDQSCPTCGQDLPQDQVEKAQAALLTAWEQKKEQSLQTIAAEGKAIAKEIASKKMLIETLSAFLAEKQEELDKARKGAQQLQEQHDAQEETPDYRDSAAYKNLEKDLEAIEKSMAQSTDTGKRDDLIRERSIKQGETLAHINTLSVFENNLKFNNRITELEEQKKAIGVKIVHIDGDLDLLSRYVSARCEAMEENINAMFTLIRWRLFELQKNGEYVDCCRATVNGVSYESSLNNAAKINAGIEIIRVLAKANNVSVPCFIDNSESVNHVAFTGGQMILLRVTEDKELLLTKEEV